MIKRGLDERFDVRLFAPIRKLEKDVEDADCAMGCTKILYTIEVILKNAILERLCVRVYTIIYFKLCESTCMYNSIRQCKIN